MRRLGFYISLTADGMYADPAGGLDVFEPSEEEHRFANQLLRDAGDVVVGRRMYELMTYWDEVDLDDPATPKVEADSLASGAILRSMSCRAASRRWAQRRRC